VYEEQKVVYKDEANTRTVSRWGYEVKPDQNPLRWFKLCLVDIGHLDPDIQESEKLIKAKELLENLNIRPEDAVTDFLSKLWKHTVASIERELGKSTVEGLPFRVIVTVPAIWPDGAMQRTKDAARRAGILKFRTCGETVLDLVPEPEAAAMATLAEFKGRPSVNPGEVITVCDCGGGTVVSIFVVPIVAGK
jgi:molecular chaperone DnaK (HSP70)